MRKSSNEGGRCAGAPTCPAPAKPVLAWTSARCRRAALTFAMLNAAAAGSAQAQSSVTLYGSLDAGVAYVNNRAGSPQAVMLQGVMQPDRIGFVGTEDLGAGWRAVFRLENG
ncbi:MAG: porin, partial [Burkholderia sp.]|nr:porin [Burkholderia sp.]